MPNTAAAKKRLRQNVKLRAKNRSQKSALRSQIRKVREAVEAGEFAKAEEEFRIASKKLDKAAAHKLVHKNMAARSKSRLAHLITKSKAAATA